MRIEIALPYFYYARCCRNQDLKCMKNGLKISVLKNFKQWKIKYSLEKRLLRNKKLLLDYKGWVNITDGCTILPRMHSRAEKWDISQNWLNTIKKRTEGKMYIIIIFRFTLEFPIFNNKTSKILCSLLTLWTGRKCFKERYSNT